MSDKECKCEKGDGCLIPIILISILIFFFWGTPDNWDKLDKIIDNKYNKEVCK